MTKTIVLAMALIAGAGVYVIAGGMAQADEVTLVERNGVIIHIITHADGTTETYRVTSAGPSAVTNHGGGTHEEHVEQEKGNNGHVVHGGHCKNCQDFD